MIYRAIDSGMVSLPDVLEGRVSLADIVEVIHYLEMKSDIEWANSQSGRKEGVHYGHRSRARH